MRRGSGGTHVVLGQRHVGAHAEATAANAASTTPAVLRIRRRPVDSLLRARLAALDDQVHVRRVSGRLPRRQRPASAAHRRSFAYPVVKPAIFGAELVHACSASRAIATS